MRRLCRAGNRKLLPRRTAHTLGPPGRPGELTPDPRPAGTAVLKARSGSLRGAVSGHHRRRTEEWMKRPFRRRSFCFPLPYKTRSLHFVFFRDFCNDPAWITCGKTIWWNISCHNTASSNNSPLADCDTATNNHVGS